MSKCTIPGCRKGIIYTHFNGVFEVPVPVDIPLKQARAQKSVFQIPCEVCERRKKNVK